RIAVIRVRDARRALGPRGIRIRERTLDPSARSHSLELSPVELAGVAAVGFVGAETRFYAGREPPTCKRAESRSDPDQKQRVRARKRYRCRQLSGESRVAEHAERHRWSVDKGLRLIKVDTAGIAHERTGYLIDWTRGARGIPSVQYKALDAKLNFTGR